MRELMMAAAAAVAVTGQTLRVPDDYPTVTEALSRAASGDLVTVAAGHYGRDTGERLPWVLDGRDIVLRGAGAGLTVVHGDLAHRLLEFRGDDRSLVEGFTLAGGWSESGGGAVLVDGASPELVRLHFTGNEADGGADALRLDSGVPRISNCLFDRNGLRGPTISVRSGSPSWNT